MKARVLVDRSDRKIALVVQSKQQLFDIPLTRRDAHRLISELNAALGKLAN